MKLGTTLSALSLLVLAGCGAHGSEVASAQATVSVHQQRQQTRDAKQGYMWNVVVSQPSLASVKPHTLMNFGGDVCNDLNQGAWPSKPWAHYTKLYGTSPRQTVAVIHAAVGFLCPEYRHLVEPSSPSS